MAPPKKTAAQNHKIEEELPEIKRLIVKQHVIGQDNNSENIKRAFDNTKRRETFFFDTAKIIEFAQEKNQYIDASNWDPKKKLPDGVPTEMTPEIMSESFHMLIEENDLTSRKFMKEILEAREKGKDMPTDPRKAHGKDQKKKDPKKPAGADEPMDYQVDEQEYDKEYDFQYILYDYPDTLEECQACQDIQDFNFAVAKIYCKETESKLTDEDIPHYTAIEDMNNYEQDLRKRFEDFMQADDPEGEKSQDLDDEELVKSQNQKSINYIERLKNFKRGVNPGSPVRTWNHFDMAYNVNEAHQDNEIPWEYNFREHAIEQISIFSNDLGIFKNWLNSVKKVPLIRPVHFMIEDIDHNQGLIDQIPQEEMIKVPSSINLKKGQDKSHQQVGKPAPTLKTPLLAAPSTVKKGKGVSSKQEQPFFDADCSKLSQAKLDEGSKDGKFKLGKNGSKVLKKPFETYSVQLSTLNIESCGPGAIQEALGDEIEVSKTGELKSKLTPECNNPDLYQKFQSSVFDHFHGDVLGQHYEKIFETPIDKTKDHFHSHSDLISEHNVIHKRSLNQKYNNGDCLYKREQMLINNQNQIGLNRYMMGDGKKPEDLTTEQLMEQTNKFSMVDMDLTEFTRKNHILNLENMFNETVGLIKWDFSERIYAEKLDDISLRNLLINTMCNDPEICYDYNKTDDVQYLGFYFKNPPGLVLHKKWENDWNILPNFEQWLNNFKGDNAMLNSSQIDLSSEDVGEIFEKRKLMYPIDGSIIDVRKYYVKDQLISRVLIKKDSWTFGIKDPLNRLVIAPEEAEIPEDGTGNDLKANDGDVPKTPRENLESGDKINLTDTNLDVKSDEHDFSKKSPDMTLNVGQEGNIQMSEQISVDLTQVNTNCCEMWVSIEEGNRLFFEMGYDVVDPEDIHLEKTIIGKNHDPAKVHKDMRLSSTYERLDGLNVKIQSNGDIFQIRVFLIIFKIKNRKEFQSQLFLKQLILWVLPMSSKSKLKNPG